MLRFYFIIIFSIIPILYFIIKCRYIEKHSQDYSEEQRYNTALYACKIIKGRGRISTDAYGLDNLPEEGGYIMYPNHQGKYDVVGMMLNHKKPLSIVIDSIRSKTLVLNEFTSVIQGKRLDKNNIKNQVTVISDVAKEVSNGRRFIIFPEGGYSDTVASNEVHDFMPGAFKAAIKSKCPIVPVALIDSYIPFSYNSLKRVKTQVHYLKPIYYEHYKNMSSIEISNMVREMIVNKINEVLA